MPYEDLSGNGLGEITGRPKSKTIPSPKTTAITPSDTEDFGYMARGLYVGSAGNVEAVNHDDTVAFYEAVPAGHELVGNFKRVNATNTTASGISAIR